MKSDIVDCMRRWKVAGADDRPFTGLVLLTSFLQEMLSLALPCILIIFLKAVSFSKFPMHC